MISNYLNVYIKEIDNSLEITPLHSTERNDYISSISNRQKKSESYSAWLLLEEVISDFLKLNIDNIKFFERSGKWSCEEFHFSLAHTSGAVAVAISDKACGIDIENLDKFKHRHLDAEYSIKLAEKVCSKNEINRISCAEEFISIWTEKEAIFKMLFPTSPSLRMIEISEYLFDTRIINFGEQYVLSVCGENLDCLKVNIIK